MSCNILYEKPFLKDVIVRFDFFTPLTDLKETLPKTLLEAARQEFPISEPTDTIVKKVDLTGSEVLQQEERFKEWRFYSKDRGKKVIITSTYLLFSYEKYPSYKAVKDDVKSLTEVLQELFPDLVVARFGMRYINSVDSLPSGKVPTDWGCYINDSLLGENTFFDGASLSRLFHVAELKFDDLNLKFQYGMPNQDFPSVIKQPQFVLDLDAYVGSVHTLTESLRYMDTAHDKIQELFENSIKDALRGVMNDSPR